MALHSLAERLQHPRRRVQRDHLPDPERERQREPARPGTDVEPRLVGSSELEERRERRVVGAARVGDEEAPDRRVEVGGLGSLANTLRLLPVGANPGGPCRQQRVRPGRRRRVAHPSCAASGRENRQVRGRVDVRVGAAHGHPDDPGGIRGEQRTEAAVAGQSRDVRPAGRQQQDRIRRRVGLVARHDRDGPGARGRVAQGAEDVGPHARLVAEDHEHAGRCRGRRGGPESERERRGEAALGRRVHRDEDPVERRRIVLPHRRDDGTGVAPQHDDHVPDARVMNGREHVGEERSPIEPRPDLPAAEARPRRPRRG